MYVSIDIIERCAHAHILCFDASNNTCSGAYFFRLFFYSFHITTRTDILTCIHMYVHACCVAKRVQNVNIKSLAIFFVCLFVSSVCAVWALWLVIMDYSSSAAFKLMPSKPLIFIMFPFL